MRFDTQEQRENVLVTIRLAASTVRFDGSDAALAQCAVLTRLRQEVEAGTVAPEVVGEAELPYLES